jgi:hypothetical protein
MTQNGVTIEILVLYSLDRYAIRIQLLKQQGVRADPDVDQRGGPLLCDESCVTSKALQFAVTLLIAAIRLKPLNPVSSDHCTL